MYERRDLKVQEKEVESLMRPEQANAKLLIMKK
jgi:hypothetical protein